MKKKYIVILFLLAVVIVCAVLIFLDYERQKNNKLDIDYKEDYKDEMNAKVVIDPILLKNGKLIFNQRKSEELIENKVNEISELLYSIPTVGDKLNDMEKFIDTELASFLDGYEECLVGSATTNNIHKGYAIQTQKKSGLAQFVNVVVTTDDEIESKILDSLELKLKGASGEKVLESTIGETPCQIFYNHIIREEETSSKKTDQYIYEIIFRHNDFTYYIKIYFCGFDINLKMIKTTKEDTSQQVSEFMQGFISRIKKQ